MIQNQNECGESAMSWERPEATVVDFHGAAIIDERGREIPITEEMVQRAIVELDQLAIGCTPPDEGPA
jgi:hypothetical protein